MDAQQARQGQESSTTQTVKSEIDWILQSIDLLASEYGWTKDDILENTFPDELLDYAKLIKQRKNSHYMMMLNIVSAPYADEEAKAQLIAQLEDRDRENEHLDKAGMMALKQKMGALGSKIGVV